MSIEKDEKLREFYRNGTFLDEATVGLSALNDGLSCHAEVVEQLIKLAAEMARGQNMPSEFLDDWEISKRTSRKTRTEIQRVADRCRKQTGDWSYELRKLADKLHKAS
jgi:hypothetical protein